MAWPETLGGSPGWEGCACGFFSLACIRIPGMLALSCCYSCLHPPFDVFLPTSGGSFFECHFFFGDSFYCVLELWVSDPYSLQGRREKGVCWSGLSGPMLWGVNESPGWGGGDRLTCPSRHMAGRGDCILHNPLYLLSVLQLYPSCLFPCVLACYLTFLSEFLCPCHAEGLQSTTCVLFLAQTWQCDPERLLTFSRPWFPTCKAGAHILYTGSGPLMEWMETPEPPLW